MRRWARIDPLRCLKAVCISAVFWLFLDFFWSRGVFDRTPHRIATAYETALPTAAQSLCRLHGWKPFKPKGSAKRKVYDLIMVNNELDWLEIRLNSTWDEVDYFIIVEASLTFTGHPKPLAIKDNFDRFKPYAAKIKYHLLEYPPDFNPKRTWDREDLQRDATFTQVFPHLTGADAPARRDVIVVADVDEIPRPETLRVLRACSFPRRLTLRSRFYYYGFQFAHRGAEWAHPQATFYEGLSGTVLPNNLRNGDGGLQPWIYWDKADLWNSAWHCSNCFRTMGELLEKMGAFSHVWMNDQEYRDRRRIADRVRNGDDLWDRWEQVYDKVQGNMDIPGLVARERERFGYLLKRDGENAGFEDFHDS